jgi:hypothetical protein
MLYERNELQRTRLLAAGKSNQRIARLGAANRTEAAELAASPAWSPDTAPQPAPYHLRVTDRCAAIFHPAATFG